DAEPESRADHQDVARAQCPNEAVIDEPEAEIEGRRILAVPQRLRVFQNVREQGRAETQRTGTLLLASPPAPGCSAVRQRIQRRQEASDPGPIGPARLRRPGAAVVVHHGETPRSLRITGPASSSP